MNYLYVSPSPSGWDNLALDEYFLDHLGEDDFLMYFYINSNAIIIGRNQNPWVECKLTEMEKDGVQLVRRITGGGAVFHDSGNLNFSFIAGEKRYSVENQLNLILNALRSIGIPCEFSGRNDLLSGGRKFSGNAFCTRKNIRQHHGTLLVNADLGRLNNYLSVDPRKLQAKGVKSVRSRVCNLSEIKPDLTTDMLLDALKNAYHENYGEYSVISNDDIDASSLKNYIEKQKSDAWRLGNTPRFDAEIENRFAWGNVQIHLTLKNGIVESAQVYSDAIDAEIAGEIKNILTGAQFGAKSLANRLVMFSQKEQIRELAAYIAGLEI